MHTNGIWKKTLKTLKRFIYDFRGFAKDEEVVKIKTVTEMANNFNLGVDVVDIRSS